MNKQTESIVQGQLDLIKNAVGEELRELNLDNTPNWCNFGDVFCDYSVAKNEQILEELARNDRLVFAIKELEEKPDAITYKEQLKLIYLVLGDTIKEHQRDYDGDLTTLGEAVQKWMEHTKRRIKEVEERVEKSLAEFGILPKLVDKIRKELGAENLYGEDWIRAALKRIKELKNTEFRYQSCNK